VRPDQGENRPRGQDEYHRLVGVLNAVTPAVARLNLYFYRRAHH